MIKTQYTTEIEAALKFHPLKIKSPPNYNIGKNILPTFRESATSYRIENNRFFFFSSGTF